MFKKQIANNEVYYKDFKGDYELERSLTAYEVYIEKSYDKEGKVLLNKDGSERYHAIDDENIVALQEDKLVKQVRENSFKDVYEVNGDYVEKVERDNKRIYFVVDSAKVTTLKAGTKVIASKGGTYRIPSEIGFVVVDDTVIESPKVLYTRRFTTDDHEAEANAAVKNSKYQHKDN